MTENIAINLEVNQYWIEKILNLFFQGYHTEFYENIMDRKIFCINAIEEYLYGIIANEILEEEK